MQMPTSRRGLSDTIEISPAHMHVPACTDMLKHAHICTDMQKHGSAHTSMRKFKRAEVYSGHPLVSFGSLAQARCGTRNHAQARTSMLKHVAPAIMIRRELRAPARAVTRYVQVLKQNDEKLRLLFYFHCRFTRVGN